MPTRQTIWPTRWLMTDERVGEALWGAIERLPTGAGVVVRHYRTEAAERADLAWRVAQICERRGLMLAIARDVALAKEVGARLVHNPEGEPGDLAISRSVHSIEEAKAAQAARAALVFVSPVHVTASHPGALPLGLTCALELARASGVPSIALGGMDEEKGAAAIRAGFHGWAAIDAWLG